MREEGREGRMEEGEEKEKKKKEKKEGKRESIYFFLDVFGEKDFFLAGRREGMNFTTILGIRR